MTWATLAKKSIETFRQIEEESNIKFYQEVGHLVVGSGKQAYMKNVLEVIEKNRIKDIKMFSGINELKMNFPYANFQTGDEAPMGLLELNELGILVLENLLPHSAKLRPKVHATVILES